jgi:hypothetical protein
MSHVAPIPAAASSSAAAPPAQPVGFLVELDSAWSAYRLYGPDHPAYARRTAAAAAALGQPLRVSINSKGFHTQAAVVENEPLLDFARRLRTLGLIGLDAQPPLTADHVSSLVLALDECDRRHAIGDAVASRIAAATGQHVKATVLRVGKLRFVQGAPRAATDDGDPASILIDFFFDRLGGGGAGESSGNGTGVAGDPAKLARSFESAIRSAGSDADWSVVVEAWNQGLLSIEAPVDVRDAGVAPEDAAKRLHDVAAFLRSLSPLLCRRLLSGTVNHHATPAAVALALVERLPLGIVLGALSEVDRSSAAPSTAAVAVLRKIAANVTPGQMAVETAPRDMAQLAEVAATLQRLLGADQEEKFVPADYFNRRQELSAGAVSPSTPLAVGNALVIPSDRETSEHAAALAFGLLASPDASPAHLTSGLEYLKNHLGEWVRGGQFSLAEQGMELAQRLRATRAAEPEIAAAAAELLASTLDADVLLEGSRHSDDPQKAIADIIKLLGQNDGAALVSLLSASHLPATAGAASATNVVLQAVRKYLPSAPEGWIEKLFGAGQTNVPQGLLGVLATMPDDDVLRLVASMAPKASPPARRALVDLSFRRKGKWPLPLIERLLRDPDADVRRIAVMRCVRDAALAGAAAYLSDSTDLAGPYPPDVAVGLSDLLHAHRRHPDVRPAYRKWFWSRRRWATFFSFSVSLDHGRRVA